MPTKAYAAQNAKSPLAPFTIERRGVLPTDFAATVRRAQDPVLDAWKGAAAWWAGASKSDRGAATVSRAEYNEKGSEYIKVRVFVIRSVIHCWTWILRG